MGFGGPNTGKKTTMTLQLPLGGSTGAGLLG
jgi:hypothetical protein